MKKPLAIQLEFDIKNVRSAVAFMTGEVMTDEEITAKFFERDPIKIDTYKELGGTDAFQICIAFTAFIMAEDKPKKEPKKSKFQQRLDEMAEQRKNKEK